MKCAKCGAELREGIKFCVQCGEKIEKAQTEEETFYSEDKNDEKKNFSEEITEKKLSKMEKRQERNGVAKVLNIVATLYLLAVVYSGSGIIGGNVQDVLNYFLLNIVIIVLLYGMAQIIQLLTDIKNIMDR